MVVAAGGSNKAFFLNVDESKAFYVQFNPKEFKLDERATWTQSDEQEATRPPLTYDKGQPTTVQMELIFDTTDTLENANTKYVEALRSFLTSSVEDTDDGHAVARPPHCRFCWGSFQFECVVEQVTSTFLMFLSDGTPVRARVIVVLKERERPDLRLGDSEVTTLSTAASMFSSVSTYTAAPGQTLSSVATATGVSTSDLADANGISDPFADLGGTTLVVPANGAQAGLLAATGRAEPPARWMGTGSAAASADPFGGAPVDDALFESAMDDLGLVLASASAGAQAGAAVAGAIGGSTGGGGGSRGGGSRGGGTQGGGSRGGSRGGGSSTPAGSSSRDRPPGGGRGGRS
jgi:LysM repeat protein